MNIYSVALNIHDHNTYDGTFHNQIERHNRIKHNLNYEWSHDPNPSKKFFNEFVLDKYKSRDENNIFAFTVSNLGQEFVIDLINENFYNNDFLKFKPKSLWEPFHRGCVYYIDHHQSHATYAFLTSGFTESDILAIRKKIYYYYWGWQYRI